jgi:GT2 family glycosyltransferase
MKIGIAVTNYNNSDLTDIFVKSVRMSAGINAHIVIVDNNSEDEEKQKLHLTRDKFDNIHCIFNKENKGYFPGLNDGIKHLLRIDEVYDAIIVGNNDLEFMSSFSHDLEKANDIIKKYPVICPNIVTLDGIHQNPHVVQPISKFRLLIWNLYFSNFLISRAIDLLAAVTRAFSARKDALDHGVAGPIFEGYGACYILTARFFEKFDALWAPTFLMGEEFFLAKQIQQSGGQLYYEPGITVLHRDHATVSKLPSKQFWKISRASHKIYLEYAKKYGHHGASTAQVENSPSQ